MPTETDDERSGERSGDRSGERIAKLLARAGIASRREIERMIAEGRIALDGVVLDTPATVLRSLHGVTVDGQPVAAPPPARLFVYHKPAGLLVTEHDPAGRPIIYDRLPSDLPRVVPVGRLDLATEGLLLLTTDGGVKRQLELPATGVERTYRARTYGDISQARLEELIDGIEIEGVRYGSIDANMERRTGANGWIELTLTEGKNREVRRVLEHLGLQVSRLIRTRYGPFVLADLMPGEVGEVRQADLVGFRRALDAKRPRTEDRVAVAARPAAVPPRPTVSEPDRPLRRRAAPAPARAEPSPGAAPARAERSVSGRAAKPGAGWGTRARPSRPAGGAAPDREAEARPARGARPGRGERGMATRSDETARPRADRSRGRPADARDPGASRPGRGDQGVVAGRDDTARPRADRPRDRPAQVRDGGGDKRPGASRPARGGAKPTGPRPPRPGKPPRAPR